MFKAMPWPDFLSDTNTGNLLGTKIAVIIIHVAFQTGFCTFVLSNYMKTIPKELGEAAMVDGASVVRQFFQVVMPLCRPALAALATLEFTWLYNDFFWARRAAEPGRPSGRSPRRSPTSAASSSATTTSSPRRR